MTDQEVITKAHAICVENTANLARIETLVEKNAKAIEANANAIAELTNDIRMIANLVAQDHNRIIDLEQLPSRRKSRRPSTAEPIPQGAKQNTP